MFQTPVISVAMGLCFTFGAVALIASALNEAFASVLKLRGRLLLDGLKLLLNRDAALLKSIYTNAVVNPMEPGQTLAKDITDRSPWLAHDGLWGMVRGRLSGGLPFAKVPSYIQSHSFAVALIDALGARQRDLASIEAAVGRIQDAQLRAALQLLLQRAERDVDRFEAGVARWFDEAMDRISGSYKRRAQLFTFFFGLLVACLLNIDATHLAMQLWSQPILQAPGMDLPPADAQAAIAQLKTLPIGWSTGAAAGGLGAAQVIGWLLTASAALFGAPFWFDILQRLVQLRSTGPKPDAGGAKRA